MITIKGLDRRARFLARLRAYWAKNQKEKQEKRESTFTATLRRHYAEKRLEIEMDKTLRNRAKRKRRAASVWRRKEHHG